MIEAEYLPFFVTAPGDSDILFTAVMVFLVLVAIGFGALYFTIQAIPDRLAAMLLAAIRLPDIVTPLKEIGMEMRRKREGGLPPTKALMEVDEETPTAEAEGEKHD